MGTGGTRVQRLRVSLYYDSALCQLGATRMAVPCRRGRRPSLSLNVYCTLARRRTAPNRTPPALIPYNASRLPSAPNALPSSTLNRFLLVSAALAFQTHNFPLHALSPSPRCSSGAGVAAPQTPCVCQRVERAVRAPRRVRGSVMTPWTPLDSYSDGRRLFGLATPLMRATTPPARCSWARCRGSCRCHN